MKRTINSTMFICVFLLGLPSVFGISCGDTLLADTLLNESLFGCSEDGLIFGASNISLNCQGFSIEGTNNSLSNEQTGLKMIGKNAVEIRNCILKDFYDGISADFGSRNIRIENTEVRHQEGKGIVIIQGSHHAQIANVTIQNAENTGIEVLNSENTTINMTTIDNVAVDGIYLQSADFTNLSNSTISGSGQHGIHLLGSSYVAIKNVSVSGSSQDGILIEEVTATPTYHVLFGNTLSENGRRGVTLTRAQNNVISNNIVFQNTVAGFWVEASSHDNEFIDNQIEHEAVGLIAEASNRTLFTNNYLEDVVNATVFIDSNATIQGNEFVNVSSAAYFSDSVSSIMRENAFPGRSSYATPYVSVVQSPFFVFSNNTLAGGWVSGEVFPEVGVEIFDSDHFLAQNNSIINLSTVFMLNGSHWCKLIFNHIDSGGMVSADASSGLNVSGNRFFGALNVSNSANVTFADNEVGKTVYTYNHDSLVRFDNVAGALVTNNFLYGGWFYSFYGLLLYNVTDLKVDGNTFEALRSSGIHAEGSSFLTVTSNDFSNIYVSTPTSGYVATLHANDVFFSNNSVRTTNFGLDFFGDRLRFADNNFSEIRYKFGLHVHREFLYEIADTAIVTGNALSLWPSSTGGIIGFKIAASNVVVEGNDLTGIGGPIDAILIRGYNSTVIVHNITVRNNTVRNFDRVNLSLVRGAIVANNTLMNLTRGLDLGGVSDAVVSGNSLEESDFGMSVVNATNISAYLNDFVGNNVQAVDNASITWNLGKGNYWSDYDTDMEGCFDADEDFICDSLYPFMEGTGSTTDNLPCKYPGCENRSINVANLTNLSQADLGAIFFFSLHNLLTSEQPAWWSFFTGEETIDSEENVSLVPGEEVFVFIANDYNASGTYVVNATGYTPIDNDTETLEVTI
ncbi:MAG: right-handed parallel beta-helix repeat-containing protein [Nanoarchaeota archaeon]